MARPEAAARKPAPATNVAPAVYTISEFCIAHRISAAMYYKIKAAGLGPREIGVGNRRLISPEAAADWRRAREVAPEKLSA